MTWQKLIDISNKNVLRRGYTNSQNELFLTSIKFPWDNR